MAKVKEHNGEQIGEEVTIFLIAVTCVEFFKILTRLMLHAVTQIAHGCQPNFGPTIVQ